MRTDGFPDDRSHALRGNAARDAPRPCVTQSVTGIHSHAERGNDHWQKFEVVRHLCNDQRFAEYVMAIAVPLNEGASPTLKQKLKRAERVNPGRLKR